MLDRKCKIYPFSQLHCFTLADHVSSAATSNSLSDIVCICSGAEIPNERTMSSSKGSDQTSPLVN